MGFHEVRLFDGTDHGAEYGSEGGPSFRTIVTELPGGGEQRVNRWSTPRRRFNIGYAIRSQRDLYRVYEFFMLRGGAANGFRLKDWVDYASTAYGTTHLPNDSAVASDDQGIGTGDGSEVDFQLTKTYTDGSYTHTRTIEKPVSGTVVVEVNGVAQTEGSDYTVDYTTGIVTFGTAPTAGHAVKAGFEFDVPVRFDITTDEFRVQIKAFETGGTPTIPLVELKNENPVPEDYPYRGGAYDEQGANLSIHPGDGLVHAVKMTTTGLSVIVPAASGTAFPLGGPYFAIINVGSNSFTVKDGLVGGTTLATLAANDTAELWLGLDTDGTTRKWYAV